MERAPNQSPLRGIDPPPHAVTPCSPSNGPSPRGRSLSAVATPPMHRPRREEGGAPSPGHGPARLRTAASGAGSAEGGAERGALGAAMSFLIDSSIMFTSQVATPSPPLRRGASGRKKGEGAGRSRRHRASLSLRPVRAGEARGRCLGASVRSAPREGRAAPQGRPGRTEPRLRLNLNFSSWDR